MEHHGSKSKKVWDAGIDMIKLKIDDFALPSMVVGSHRLDGGERASEAGRKSPEAVAVLCNGAHPYDARHEERDAARIAA